MQLHFLLSVLIHKYQTINSLFFSFFFLQEYFYPKYVGKSAKLITFLNIFVYFELFLSNKRSFFSAACLGSHRVGINSQHSDAGIPSNLRTCVKGELKPQTKLFICLLHFSVAVKCCVSKTRDQ